MLRRLVLVGVTVLLVGTASFAEPAQDDSIEAVRTRANAGDAEAQFNLGVMQDNGLGVPQDDVEAYKWFNLATTYIDASQREEYAEARDTAAERLTPQQRAEGQKLSREWFAAHPRP